MKNINFKVASFSSFRLLASYTNQITYRGEEVGELSGKQGGHDPIMVPFRVSRAEGQKKKIGSRCGDARDPPNCVKLRNQRSRF